MCTETSAPTTQNEPCRLRRSTGSTAASGGREFADRLGHTEAAVRQRASRLRAVQFEADVAGAGLPAFVHDEHALVGELGQGAAAQVGAAFAFLKAWHAGKRGVAARGRSLFAELACSGSLAMSD